MRRASFPAGPPVVVRGPAGSGLTTILRAVADRWTREGHDVVAIDDIDRRSDEQLAVIVEAIEAGRSVVVAHRHPCGRAAVSSVDALVGRVGTVVTTEPLDDETLATIATDALGRSAADHLGELARASGRQAGLAAAIVGDWVRHGFEDERSPGVDALVHGRTAGLSAEAAAVLDVVVLAPVLPVHDLAAAAGVELSRLPLLVDELVAAGLVDPDEGTAFDVVGRAHRRALSSTARAVRLDAVARVLVNRGAPPADVARVLAAAGAVGPMAADAYRAAGDEVRFADPVAALAWFARADRAGAGRSSLAAGRAEALAVAGDRAVWDAVADADLDDDGPPGPVPGVGGDVATRLRLVVAALEARAGRWERAGGEYLRLDERALAALAAIAVGTPAPPASSAPAPVGHTARVLDEWVAAAARAVGPRAEVAPLLQAATAAERATLGMVLPDTPHAQAAVVALVRLDAPLAEHLCAQGLAAGVGGPGAATRLYLLQAWARLRRGQYESAAALRQDAAAADPDGRDLLWSTALVAAQARRSANVTALASAWAGAEPLLAAQAVDLWSLDAWCELAIAAARVRSPRAAPVLAELVAIVGRLGDPPAWSGWLAWRRHEVAIVAGDRSLADEAEEALDRAATGDASVGVLAAAARTWSAVTGGRAASLDVPSVAERLAGIGLPWEAATLMGQAAIRVADARVSRDLLERARDLRAQPGADGEPGDVGALSDREADVARLVLDGLTHKEIGAQLFISAKTVEHHVARIRTKLGAGSRAELLAELRRILAR